MKKKGGGVEYVILNRSKCHWSKDCLVQKHQIGKLYQESIQINFEKNWLIFKMNRNNGKSIENFNDIPEFYQELINCWVEFGGGQTKTPTNYREIRNQNIWGNKYIKFNNKSLIDKKKLD